MTRHNLVETFWTSMKDMATKLSAADVFLQKKGVMLTGNLRRMMKF